MYFLATTAIERFWNKNQPILFLQEGCCRFSRRKYNSGINYKILPSIISDPQKVKKWLCQVEVSYEKVLNKLYSIMNRIHNTNYSERYWRIVIGRWLYCYIFAMYDRYYSIKYALEFDLNLETILLDKSCYTIPNDMKTFLDFLLDDAYNLQIYSQVFNYLGMDFPVKKLVYQTEPFSKLEEITKKSISRKPTNSIVMCRSYFSTMVELMLINKCEYPVETYWGKEESSPVFSINFEMRNEISIPIKSENDFEQFIVDSIKNNIPRAYLEAYNYIKNSTEDHPIFSNRPRVILTAVSFDTDEVFKQWAADCAEQGTKIVGVAHSAAHVDYNSNPWEIHMKAVCDRYYIPGLISKEDKENISVAPSPKFCYCAKVHNLEKVSDILFISTNNSRFASGGFPVAIAPCNERYFSNQQNFWENLSENCKKNIRVRLYAKDWGQDCAERWRSFAPNIILEGWEIPLSTRIGKSRVVICDNFATTFTETMIFNKPTIIYLDCQEYKNFYHPEALKCFDKLREVGILHDNPVSASNMLNQIYENIDEWWMDSSRQQVINYFCELFTNCSNDSVRRWVNELNVLCSDDGQRKELNLKDQLNLIPGNKIAFLGINEFTQYLINSIVKLTSKKVVGIVDSDDSPQIGKELSGVKINSLSQVLKNAPDVIIISEIRYAKQLEKKIKQYVGTIEIVNIARDFHESVFRDILLDIYGENAWNLI